MKRPSLLLAILATALAIGGCHVGEQTAPKPDPNQFLPKDKSGGGPPPSSPSVK